MVAAFGTGRVRNTDRWLTRFPRLDRGALARLGALQPGNRTDWTVKGQMGVAHAFHISCTAAADGLTISTGEQQQIVRYWYDSALPHGGLRQFFTCPACERICRTIYFEDRWGCRVCLKLNYPIRGLASVRARTAYGIADLQRSLLKARPGSRLWHELRAQIAQQYATLTADVARVRRDLKRRLANDYKR